MYLSWSCWLVDAEWLGFCDQARHPLFLLNLFWGISRTKRWMCSLWLGMLTSWVSLFPAEPLPLMDLCRRAVRLALGKERLNEIPALPLPASLKSYLLYQWPSCSGTESWNQGKISGADPPGDGFATLVSSLLLELLGQSTSVTDTASVCPYWQALE